MRLEGILVGNRKDAFARKGTRVDANTLNHPEFVRVLERAGARIKEGFIEALARAAILYPELSRYYQEAATKVAYHLSSAYFEPAPDSYGRDWDITDSIGSRFHIRLYDRVFDGFHTYPLITYDQVTGQVEIEWDIGRASQSQLQTNLQSLGLHWYRSDEHIAFNKGEEAWHLLKAGFEVGFDDSLQLKEVYDPRTGAILPVSEARRQMQEGALLRRYAPGDSYEIVVDRIEGMFAVLIGPNLKQVDMPLEFLPIGIKEGDSVAVAHGMQHGTTDARRERFRSLLEQTFGTR